MRYIELCRFPLSSELRVLVETPFGSGPNARQRKQVADYFGDRDLRTAVLTQSLAVHGILTALSWLGIAVRPYRLGEYEAAALYLGLTHEEIVEARSQLALLRNRLGVQISRQPDAERRVP